jgi:hypothetical protein
MNAVLTALVCGALVFVEQDIPGLRVGRAEPFSGERWRNFRQADIDRDGKIDLVLPDCIAFQRGDAFRMEDRQPLPEVEAVPSCDLWDATVYFRLPVRLACVQWTADGWATLLDQDIHWPDAEIARREALSETQDKELKVHFERFLEDIDGDGQPEILVASERGVHIFAKQGDAYAEAGVLDVLPPLKLIPGDPVPFWPPEARRIPTPELQLSCRFFIAGSRLAVLEADYLPENRARHRIRDYTLERNESGIWTARLTQVQETPLIKSDMRPCRLNQDEIIDFAGGEWALGTGGILHAPVYETHASTDAGETVQYVRSVSFRPACSFVDFNSDGRLDMLTETSGLFAGGVRETVTRFASAHSINHTLRVHLQKETGTFPGTPDLRSTFKVRIDRVPARSGERFSRYLASELIDVTGDFDGDGIRDAVVHGDARRINVFRGSLRGFSSRPLMAAETQPDWRFAVDDVDCDGRSDIVFRWMDPESADAYEHCRVFLTREKAR